MDIITVGHIVSSPLVPVRSIFALIMYSPIDRLSVTAVPSKKSSIQPGDRVLEINGVPYTDFKTEKAANELFEKLVLDIIPNDEDDDDEEEEEEDDLD